MEKKYFNLETNIEIVDEVAEASVALNPLFRWAKFVLTDDKPNRNKQRIPQEEFANLIRTGKYTPIKMKLGGISRGHEYSVPLGVITDLVEENDKVIGLAALWEKEREADVNLIKSLKDKQIPVNLSWEIYYSDSSEEEDGVQVLRGTCLRAATIVGEPAYGGRTPILKMASLESQIMELQELESKVQELQTSMAEMTEKLTAKEQEVVQRDETISALTSEKDALTEYKSQIEQAEQKKERLASIKNMFNEAGITKGDEYFQENEEKLLALSEDALNFVVQELASTLSTASVKSTNSGDIPPLSSDSKTKLNPRELGRQFRELSKK